MKVKEGDSSAYVTLDNTYGTKVVSERMTVTKAPPGVPPTLEFFQKIRDTQTGAIEQRLYRLKLTRRFLFKDNDQSSARREPFDPAVDTVFEGSTIDYTTLDWQPFCRDRSFPGFAGYQCGLRKDRTVPDFPGEDGEGSVPEELSWSAFRQAGEPLTGSIQHRYSTYKDGVGTPRLEGLVDAKYTSVEPCRTGPCPAERVADPDPLLTFQTDYYVGNVQGNPELYVDGVGDADGLPDVNAEDVPWAAEFEAVGHKLGWLSWD